MPLCHKKKSIHNATVSQEGEYPYGAVSQEEEYP